MIRQEVTIDALFDQGVINTILVDAAGVLYHDEGAIAGVSATIRLAQQKGINVFLVTNNTYHYIDEIQKKLQTIDIYLDEAHIISSGLGLAHDQEMHELLENKRVYVFGKPGSKRYVELAPIKEMVSELTLADIVVMAATIKGAQEALFSELYDFLSAHPTCPVICINPDHFVRSGAEFIKVIGYYATIIETDLPNPVFWMGKPYESFSLVVKKIAEKNPKVTLDKSCFFFDDNIENVISMQQTLGISGCLVRETGLAKNRDLKKAYQDIGMPAYTVPSFGLKHTS